MMKLAATTLVLIFNYLAIAANGQTELDRTAMQEMVVENAVDFLPYSSPLRRLDKDILGGRGLMDIGNEREDDEAAVTKEQEDEVADEEQDRELYVSIFSGKGGKGGMMGGSMSGGMMGGKGGSMMGGSMSGGMMGGKGGMMGGSDRYDRYDGAYWNGKGKGKGKGGGLFPTFPTPVAAPSPAMTFQPATCTCGPFPFEDLFVQEDEVAIIPAIAGQPSSVGTHYVYDGVLTNFTTGGTLRNGAFFTGHCIKIRQASTGVAGLGYCHFTYVFLPADASLDPTTMNVAGEVQDETTTLMAITGGTNAGRTFMGDVSITPIPDDPSTGTDWFLNSAGYVVDVDGLNFDDPLF